MSETIERIIRAVHPRRYGELCALNYTSCKYCGSSPQVRGTLGRGRSLHPPMRFIPAGTGNSIKAYSLNNRVTVHPRRYGELSKAGQSIRLSNGSSPQVRGTHGYNTFNVAGVRFIPAGTGNSLRKTETIY